MKIILGSLFSSFSNGRTKNLRCFLIFFLGLSLVLRGNAQTKRSSDNFDFIVAADKGDTAAVNKFIASGININRTDFYGGSALFYAANNSHDEVVSILLASGANPNIGIMGRFTPLMAAVRNNDTAVVNLLVRNRLTNIDLPGPNKATALFYAVSDGYQEILKILLYYGADPNIALSSGFTPLMSAATYNDVDMAQLLLYDARTKLDSKDINAATALHYAAFHGSFFIVDMLLFYGANADRKTSYGDSPLLMGAFSGDIDLTVRLMETGNSVIEENKRGFSPVKIAVQFNDSLLLNSFIKNLDNPEITSEQKLELLKFSIAHQNAYATRRLLDTLELDSLGAAEKQYLVKQACISENREIVRLMKGKNLTTQYSPVITAIQTDFSISFNAFDHSFFYGLGLKESHYDMAVMLRYGGRFNVVPVMQRKDSYTVYQLWENRHHIGLQLKKFIFSQQLESLNFKPYVSGEFQYHYGTYNGMSREIEDQFEFVSEFGFRMDFRWVFFDIAYQYANYGLHDIPPHRLNVGVGLNFQFYAKPRKYEIRWM